MPLNILSAIGVEGRLASCTVSSVVPPTLALRADPRAIPLVGGSLSPMSEEFGVWSPSGGLTDASLLDVLAGVKSESAILEFLPPGAGLREVFSFEREALCREEGDGEPFNDRRPAEGCVFCDVEVVDGGGMLVPLACEASVATASVDAGGNSG